MQMKLIRQNLSVFILLFGVLACATKPVRQGIQLSQHINYVLSSPPAELIGTVHTHIVQANFNGKSQRFIAQVEYQYEQISLAGVSTSGVPLFDFVWRKGDELTINQYVPLPGLDINYVIADMQWVNWPIENLIAATSGDGLSITQTDLPADLVKENPQNNWLRVVKHHKDNILTVKKISNQYFLSHQLRDYSITITNISKEVK